MNNNFGKSPDFDSLVESVTKVTKTKVELQSKVATLQNKLEGMKEERHSLEDEESSLGNKLTELFRQNASLKNDCGLLERELETEKASHNTLVLTVDALLSKKHLLQQDLEKSKNEFDEERILLQGSASLTEGIENLEFLAFAGWCCDLK